MTKGELMDHRHGWSVGWDGYVCECGSERPFSDKTLTAVVVERGAEERIVQAVVDALRAEREDANGDFDD